MNSVQIRSADRALSVGTWLIVGGAMLYSILTVTPLAARHTPAEWQWTAPILPLVVDAAVVIVVRLDATMARLGGNGGWWPIALRWMTGIMTLALNVADSALQNDLVGVAVHSVAPLLLIVTAETGLAYRRAIAAALNDLNARQQAEKEAREQAAAGRREAAEHRAREEREHKAALAREQRDHEAALAREQREHEDRARREEQARIESRERTEREARERAQAEREQQQAERERREREAAQRRDRERREREAREHEQREREQQQAEREQNALLAAGPATEKQPEDLARSTVRAAFGAGLPVRSAVELTGWSIGWVSSRYQELRDAAVLEGASS
ncbi:DUF2637 domain-containing protein [Streptomyces sp. NBC_01500]|uniref:DUF2637 domain-containing protein n=1 Tax=Streptomyces sp. NBC_01500 TaxID=2903886 RepID=UPI0022524B0A|nr:DUF2637 domain-containing protein [Streptomyces sp. NBC_01500]MCX4549455.1 DUF2637 domain-containing protein [Streptomyces sp. NBC_01500]